MQHALKHVERPGGSHTALDGKKSPTREPEVPSVRSKTQETDRVAFQAKCNDVQTYFFSVQRLHGSRQVVQHVSEHVAIGINWLIKSRKGRCCSGRKSKLVEDRYIVLCTVTLIKKTKQNTKKQRNKDQKQHQTQTENKQQKHKHVKGA